MDAEEIPFLHAVFQERNEDAPRLIYADWLEDRGDSRAAFLRLEVELFHLPKNSPQRKTLGRRVSGHFNLADASWERRVYGVRNIQPGIVHDFFCLRDGRGLIEILGGSSETALLVESKPVAFNWDDCQGSVGQYLVRTDNPGDKNVVRQLQVLVDGGSVANRPLNGQIDPMLVLFASGFYYLRYEPAALGEIGSCRQPVTSNNLEGYYPFDRNLIWTQPDDALTSERVGYFRERIRAKQRPIVLTTSAESALCEFVIDGHHKLEAYEQEKQRPAILCIERWNAPRISKHQGIGYLPHGHPGIAEYRRMKRHQIR